MEKIEVENLSVYTNVQHQTCSNGDSSSDSKANLNHLVNKNIPSQDIVDRKTVKYSYTKTLCKAALLICAILFVIGVMQLPITLYYTAEIAPSLNDFTLTAFSTVDFKSCSVS